MPKTPKPKPYTEEKFKKEADKYIKGYLGGFDQGEMNQFLKRSVDKIENAGVMSSDEAKDFIKERASYLREFAKDNPGETLPQLNEKSKKTGDPFLDKLMFLPNTLDKIAEKIAPMLGYAEGGRIGFKVGGNKSYADYEREERIAELESLMNRLMTEEGIQDKGYAAKLASDLIDMKNKGIDSDRLKFLNERSAIYALPTNMRPEPEYYDALRALEKRMGIEKKAKGGRIGYSEGSDYFDEQKTNVKGKKTTGPVKGGKTPEIPPEEFRKYLKYKKNKVVQAANGGRIGFELGSMDPDTLALKEKIEEIMDIEGVGFGEAFKQAMRELASQSKEND